MSRKRSEPKVKVGECVYLTEQGPVIWDGGPHKPITAGSLTGGRMSDGESCPRCRETLDSPERWMKWCDNRVLERCEALQARVERLEAELRWVADKAVRILSANQIVALRDSVRAALGDSK